MWRLLLVKESNREILVAGHKTRMETAQMFICLLLQPYISEANMQTLV